MFARQDALDAVVKRPPASASAEQLLAQAFRPAAIALRSGRRRQHLCRPNLAVLHGRVGRHG
jgi:hypothetical protein